MNSSPYGGVRCGITVTYACNTLYTDFATKKTTVCLTKTESQGENFSSTLERYRFYMEFVVGSLCTYDSRAIEI